MDKPIFVIYTVTAGFEEFICYYETKAEAEQYILEQETDPEKDPSQVGFMIEELNKGEWNIVTQSIADERGLRASLFRSLEKTTNNDLLSFDLTKITDPIVKEAIEEMRVSLRLIYEIVKRFNNE